MNPKQDYSFDGCISIWLHQQEKKVLNKLHFIYWYLFTEQRCVEGSNEKQKDLFAAQKSSLTPIDQLSEAY